MRVLLAYNHILFLQGLKSLLKKDPSYEIVGTAKDGHEVVELAKDLSPDLVIMDFSIPLQSSLVTTKKIKENDSLAKIVLLSMYEQDSYVIQALKVGASAYILKNNVYQELKEALAALKRGEIYLSPSVSKEIRKKIGTLVIIEGEKRGCKW